MDHSNKFAGYNMFITHWKHFDAHSEWLFDILFEVEKRVPPIEDPIQSRIYSYMNERLINVFCKCNNLHIKHIPLIMPLENYREESNISYLRASYRNIINNLKYMLNL